MLANITRQAARLFNACLISEITSFYLPYDVIISRERKLTKFNYVIAMHWSYFPFPGGATTATLGLQCEWKIRHLATKNYLRSVPDHDNYAWLFLFIYQQHVVDNEHSRPTWCRPCSIQVHCTSRDDILFRKWRYSGDIRDQVAKLSENNIYWCKKTIVLNTPLTMTVVSDVENSKN